MEHITCFGLGGLTIRAEAISLGDALSLGVAVLSTLISVIGLIFHGLSVRRQARVTSFNNASDILSQISEAWRRFRDAKDDKSREYELIEVLNKIEISCYAYNRGIIRGSGSSLLFYYVKTVLPSIFNNEKARTLFEEHRVDATTYCEILKFARNAKIDNAPGVQAAEQGSR